MDSTRRSILAAGAAAAATAAVPAVFAQSSTHGAGKFYEKGPVRIYYEESGSGFPLLLIPGGGLNSTIAFFTGNSPFNAIQEFQSEYRSITADLRNAPSGQSSGPVEVERPRGVSLTRAAELVDPGAGQASFDAQAAAGGRLHLGDSKHGTAPSNLRAEPLRGARGQEQPPCSDR